MATGAGEGPDLALGIEAPDVAGAIGDGGAEEGAGLGAHVLVAGGEDDVIGGEEAAVGESDAGGFEVGDGTTAIITAAAAALAVIAVALAVVAVVAVVTPPRHADLAGCDELAAAYVEVVASAACKVFDPPVRRGLVAVVVW
jgi:hypothetical protein